MKKFRKWAFWRRVQYGLGFFFILGLVSTGVYRIYFYSPGDCFDTMMNNTESGTDCGGACVRICTATITPPKVLWAKSFEITDGQYNAVAYIENQNQIAATPELKYTFEFFAGDKKVGEKSGTTVLPPKSIYPIFEGRLYFDESITETKLTVEPAELWVPTTLGREQFKTTSLDLIAVDTEPRLNVSIENTALTKAVGIEVVATLFNAIGEPITASQTFIDSFEGRSNKDIVFTWPQPLSKTIRSCEIPSDIVMAIDLSGSMNNDGGDPPQPVTDALLAAKQFVSSLKSEDKAAVVTFASEAVTVSELSKNHLGTADIIGRLNINPVDELGFTNTAAGIKAAATELASARHSTDSRRAVVLLTDGLPTAPGDTANIMEETKITAKTLAESGVEVYAIGLGKGVDTAFIATLASKGENAYLAPKTSDLEQIYQQITGSLCESGATRIDVIAKTGANFTPLR
ncbi:MAG: vWA domain-containing protein [Patescibacteria group bacterium]